MIPHVIHYFWFGNAPLPALAKQCIASWRRYLPGWTIKRWDETNYDVNAIAYTQEAYQARKWAFVSDYARMDVLHRYGGLYFDTDVELIGPIDDIVDAGPFIGCQIMDAQKENAGIGVAPVALGAAPGLALLEEIIAHYRGIRFVLPDGTYNINTNIAYTTDILKRHGFDESRNAIQNAGGMTVYPPAYFSPVSYFTGKRALTDDTRAIHHFASSWLTPLEKRIVDTERFFNGKGKAVYAIGKCCSLPLRIWNRVSQEGFRRTMAFVLQKLKGPVARK